MWRIDHPDSVNLSAMANRPPQVDLPVVLLHVVVLFLSQHDVEPQRGVVLHLTGNLHEALVAGQLLDVESPRQELRLLMPRWY